jgi:L-fuculose-phosphate aldolase
VVIRYVGWADYGMQFGDGKELAGMLSETRPAIVLENDGVLATGKDPLQAFDRLEVLEATAEAIINSKAVGSLQPLDDQVTRDLDRVFFGI